MQSDPRWWGGEPIWNTAERQGGKSARDVLAGVGSHDRRPSQATYWTPFDDDMPNGERVKRILDWLRLPEGERPSFLTLYFSDVDNAGHSSGPDSEEVRDAVMRVDKSIGDLVAGVRQAGLADRVHYLVVSDHGMAALSPDRMIVLDDYIDVAAVDVVDWSPVLALSPKDGDVERMYAALKDKHPALAVYQQHRDPAGVRACRAPSACRRFSALRKTAGTSRSKAEVVRWSEPDRRAPGGAHGYDGAPDSRCRACSSPTVRGFAHGLRVQAIREHSRLRIHVRGAGPAAGEQRRRSGRDSRYAPIQSMTANSDRITAAGWKIVLLASLGGTLEFYDFVIFGVFAPRHRIRPFFRATDPLVSLILSYATFAVGYLARPIGGIVLSHYGDRYGRRAVFLWSVFIMSGATLGMGLVPDYAQIGVAASLLMVTLRLIQGFCLGGELPGALTYVVETAPRIAPFVCGVVFACVTMGVAVATGVSLSVRTFMDPAAGAGVWLAPRVRARRPWRRTEFRAAAIARGVAGVRSACAASLRASLSRELLRTHFKHVLIGCLLLAGTGCFNGLFFSHLPGYLSGVLQIRPPPGRALADRRRDRIRVRHPRHRLAGRSHSAALPAARRRRAAAGVPVLRSTARSNRAR